MTRTSLAAENCSLARTADVIGDKWTLVILREAFYGVRNFTGFQSRLGVARTVLSDRLQRLIDAGVLEKARLRDGIDRSEYRLTDAGRDLFPVVVALIQWGDRWMFGPGDAPVSIVDRTDGSPVQPIAVLARDGRPLAARETSLGPGPGATAQSRELFASSSRRTG